MVSSMTTNIDDARIEHEVTQYYRYATFSHRWEDKEPLFEKVIHVVVYKLEESLTHNKLRTFCKIVRDDGLHWAWSDTCCINKADHFILQEALVSMFKWYEGSTVTIVYLRDVRSSGDLVKSVWNQRAWTFQEYHASKVVRFYTEDWTPYLNLDIPNHKESPEIISEMEKATSISPQILTSLCPGLDDIRAKLSLASRRKTTLTEDAAYSLLGIFSASLPILYGEGDKALGKLLAQLLTSSGDTSILAWTGKSGTFNSCLPFEIAVFSQPPTTHIPPSITEMDRATSGLHVSTSYFDQAEKLYRKLGDLPVPMLADKRMRLPCISFKLGRLSLSRNESDRVYRALTDGLGIVEIRTKEDLSRFETLYLVHPWIDFLLHRHPVGSIVETTTPEGSIDGRSDVSSSAGPSSSPLPPPRTTTATTILARRSHFASRFKTLQFPGRTGTGLTFAGPAHDTTSLLPPASISADDRRTHVLQFIVRLRQPFGALLLTPTRQNACKRVAADCVIEVKVLEGASLKELCKSADILDVL